MKILTATVVGVTLLLPTSSAFAQDGNMMGGNNWRGGCMRGGYGGWWVPVLLVVLMGVTVRAVLKKRKQHLVGRM